MGFHEMNEVLRNENALKFEELKVMLENKNEALRLELEDLRGLLQSQPRRTDAEREQMPFLDCINTDDSDADNIYFDGCNVHVRSGEGSTRATTNGKGNLIIGYNEPRDSLMEVPESAEGLATKVEASRFGSHNLIIGDLHEYTSYGGIVTGVKNRISNAFSAVVGGYKNAASGKFSTVTGGSLNEATGYGSFISGGYFNTASGELASISGGEYNTATGISSSISGGWGNTATGYSSSISGGSGNTASGKYSLVLGGKSNVAQGEAAVVTGGIRNKAIGELASVVGGKKNIARKKFSVVTGA